MSTRGHVGVLHPDGTVSVRYVHHADPGYITLALARIWWHTFARDTEAMVQVLLAHDWSDLDPATTADRTEWFGGTPVAGVGMTVEHQRTATAVTGPWNRIGALHGTVYLLDRSRPGVLVVSDDTDPRYSPTFDLNIGRRVGCNEDSLWVAPE